MLADGWHKVGPLLIAAYLTLLIYVLAYTVRSRNFVTVGNCVSVGENSSPVVLWSFYDPPFGLHTLDLSRSGVDREQERRRKERLTGWFFRPCIIVGEMIFPRRRYLLTFDGMVCYI